jgi:hypothetical protein
MDLPQIISLHSIDAPQKERVEKSVERLLHGIPKQYTIGLSRVILRDSANLTRHEKMKRKLAGPEKVLLGCYHKQWRGEGAFIELFVDKIMDQSTSPLLRFSFWLDLLISDVLYHELGHHIHRTLRPERKNPESTANHWRRTLRHLYFRRRYRLIIPVIRVAAYAGKVIRKRRDLL